MHMISSLSFGTYCFKSMFRYLKQRIRTCCMHKKKIWHGNLSGRMEEGNVINVTSYKFTTWILCLIAELNFVERYKPGGLI